MPVYNLEREIARTLSSVRAQTTLPDEIVIVDDGSTDASVAIIEEEIKSFPAGVVKLVAREHSGPGATRNHAIAQARFEWIAFLDGDDLWAPTKIASLREAITGHPEATIIAHDEYESDLRGPAKYKPLHERFRRDEPLLPQLYYGNFLSTSCIAARADAIRAAGCLDASLPSAQDYDLWLKLARDARLVFLPEPLATYVLRENSISSRIVTRYECMCLLARRHSPFVARFTGARRAAFLRIRFIAASGWNAVVQAAREKDFGSLLAIMFRFPYDLLRAALRGWYDQLE